VPFLRGEPRRRKREKEKKRESEKENGTRMILEWPK